MCNELPYICVHFLLKSDNFLINPSNLIVGSAKDIVGIEMQFAQAERGPTPLPSCKFTLMKIHNIFFFGEQPTMS